MSKPLSARHLPAHVPAGPLVTRVLDRPDAIEAIQALPVATLGALVQHVGLEDAGELLALATTDQLVGLLDEDAWQPAEGGPGELLDAGRFALWLAVLVDAGVEAAAARLAELPEELVVHGLGEQVLVLDMDALASEIAGWDEDEVEEVEKALEAAPHQEIDRFRLVSRGGEHFDALVDVLVTLDRDQHPLLERWLERLADVSSAAIEDEGGLVSALSAAEELAEDAAAERDARRAAAGFVARADARAFLALARAQSPDEALADARGDAISRAWFRELAPTPVRAAPAADRLVTWLRDAGVPVGRGAPALPARAAAGELFQVAMRDLASQDPALEARRREELAFLVNVLLADVPGRRPIDAMTEVLGRCERGLAHAVRASKGQARRTAALAALRAVGAVRLFRAGVALAQS